jgi:hydroxymethylpyrimidine/phosphomethylpyrimidine kinase
VTPVVALTIAGSDSSGGAGLQADLKTFAAHRVHGTCAVTAVTAQNTIAVDAVVALEPAFVVAQVDAVLADLTVAGVKTGMLATSEIVAAVAAMAAAGRLPNLTVDPVLVSSTGHLLMDEGGVAAFRELLLPHAQVATPNLREAAVLAGRPLAELATVEGMIDAAQSIRAFGATTVVVKGGHLAAAQGGRAPVPGAAGTDRTGPASPDVIAGPDGVLVLEGRRIETPNDHGTGCSLSAAIVSGLALGEGHVPAIRAAKHYVATALAGAAGWRLGAGHGPIDHFGWSSPPSGPASTRP